MATAVLDIGKTNAKLVVVGEDGSILWSTRRPNTVRPGPPYPHADVDTLWAFATTALSEAVRHAAIDAVVTTTHGATAALVDDAGLVLPVLDYEHPAPFEEEHGYGAVRPAFTETLSPALPAGLNLARQLHWQQRRFPEAFARVRHVLPYPQYWAWRLSGVAACEVTSLGTHTDLWEPAAGRYSALVDACGWGPLFPPMRKAWDVLGPVTPAVAAATGLSVDCRVVCGIHDSNASLLPHLVARRSPFTVVSTGTWAIIMGVGATGALDEARDTLANVNLFGSPVATARFMAGREYEALVPAGSPAATAEDVAAVIASGCLALPGFAGRCGPFPSGIGRIEGDLPSRPGAAAALGALYLALMTDACLSLIGAGGDIVVEGGLAGNEAYLGVLAALREGQGVLASADATGTTQGAALLARWPATPAATGQRKALPGVWPGLSAYRRTWHDRACRSACPSA